MGVKIPKYFFNQSEHRSYNFRSTGTCSWWCRVPSQIGRKGGPFSTLAELQKCSSISSSNDLPRSSSHLWQCHKKCSVSSWSSLLQNWQMGDTIRLCPAAQACRNDAPLCRSLWMSTSSSLVQFVGLRGVPAVNLLWKWSSGTALLYSSRARSSLLVLSHSLLWPCGAPCGPVVRHLNKSSPTGSGSDVGIVCKASHPKYEEEWSNQRSLWDSRCDGSRSVWCLHLCSSECPASQRRTWQGHLGYIGAENYSACWVEKRLVADAIKCLAHM